MCYITNHMSHVCGYLGVSENVGISPTYGIWYWMCLHLKKSIQYIAPAISYANNIQLLYPRCLNEQPDVLYVFYMLTIFHEYSMTTSF